VYGVYTGGVVFKRTRSLNLRLRPDELSRWRKEARRTKQTLSAWLRTAATLYIAVDAVPAEPSLGDPITAWLRREAALRIAAEQPSPRASSPNDLFNKRTRSRKPVR
jgi:hypothetical protein